MKYFLVVLSEAIIFIIALHTESIPTVNHFSQILLAVVCHEGAHIIAADILKINNKSFSIFPMGIKMEFSSSELSSFKSVCVCLAGSVGGFITAAGVYFIPFKNLDVFVFTSISLSIVNLLPIKCFDGGEILDILMSDIFLPDTAQRITQAVSETVVLLFWFLTVMFQMKHGTNLAMMIFAVYLLYRSL